MPNVAQYQRGFGRRKPGPAYRVDFSHPLARGLVGCWLLNEGGGAVAFDLSGYGNNLAIVGNPWSVGPLGTDLLFGGTLATKARCGTATLPNAGAQDVSLLVWAVMTVNSGKNEVISISAAPDSAPGLAISNEANNWSVSGAGNTAPPNLASGVTPVLGGLYLLAFTRLGSLNTLYVISNSGQTVVTNTNAVQSGVYGAVTLGSFDGNYDPFNGHIPMGAVYNRALSAAEISWLYREPFAFVQQAAPKRAFFGPGGGATRSLFRQTPLDGLGVGGSFFGNPLGG